MKNTFNPLSKASLVLATLALTSVSISVNAQERIISAGANITELFFALEAQDQLVAVDVTSKSYVAGTAIPQVGYHRQLSAEGLMALNPTRLIGSDEMGPDTTLDLLAASEVEVMTMPAGNSIEALNQRIDIIAGIVDKPSQAEKIKQKVVQDIANLKNSPLSVKPKVMFLMINEDRPATAAGSNTPIDKIISLSGAVNPAAKEMESYKPLSYEAIINMQPDYILVSDRAWHKFGGADQILQKLPLLAATPAGTNGGIVSVPSRALVGGFGLQSLELAKTLNTQFASH